MSTYYYYTTKLFHYLSALENISVPHILLKK